MRKTGWVWFAALLVLGGLLSVTPTFSTAQGPGRTITPKAFTEDEAPDLTLVTPAAEVTMIPPLTGTVIVMVQLASSPLAEVGRQALREGLTLPEVLDRMRDERAALQNEQQTLVDRLTAPPYNARLVATTLLVSNTVVVEVDAQWIDAIRTLPGVLTARPERPGQLDPSMHEPGRPPGFGPHLD
jgi:hypothetical protein